MLPQNGQERIGGLAYNVRLTWNPTPLTTVTVTGARTIQQSPFANQAGILKNQKAILANQKAIQATQKTIQKNQGTLLANQKAILGNQKRILAK